MTALDSGSTMRPRMPYQPSPSIIAASSISLGRFSKKDFMTRRLNTEIAPGSTIAHMVFFSPSDEMST